MIYGEQKKREMARLSHETSGRQQKIKNRLDTHKVRAHQRALLHKLLKDPENEDSFEPRGSRWHYHSDGNFAAFRRWYCATVIKQLTDLHRNTELSFEKLLSMGVTEQIVYSAGAAFCATPSAKNNYYLRRWIRWETESLYEDLVSCVGDPIVLMSNGSRYSVYRYNKYQRTYSDEFVIACLEWICRIGELDSFNRYIHHTRHSYVRDYISSMGNVWNDTTWQLVRTPAAKPVFFYYGVLSPPQLKNVSDAKAFWGKVCAGAVPQEAVFKQTAVLHEPYDTEHLPDYITFEKRRYSNGAYHPEWKSSVFDAINNLLVEHSQKQ